MGDRSVSGIIYRSMGRFWVTTPLIPRLQQLLATPLSSRRSLICLPSHLMVCLVGLVRPLHFHREIFLGPVLWSSGVNTPNFFVSKTAVARPRFQGRVTQHSKSPSGSYILPPPFKMFPEPWRGAKIYNYTYFLSLFLSLDCFAIATVL